MLRRDKVSRRAFLAGSAVVMAGSALAGCAPAATPAPGQPVTQPKEGAPVPKKEPVALSLMTWWLPPIVYGTATELAVKAFNERNEDINVTIEPNPGGIDAQMQKWQTALAAGAPPDVTLMRPHFHTAFA